MKTPVTSARIENKIHVIRNRSIMLDYDLAVLYGVKTKVLIQAVKRNIKRFPEDFLFQLNRYESDFLRSQIVTLEKGRGKHRKYLPTVFTEQGVAMLSTVLNSDRAIQVNIQIMRAFIRLRGDQYSIAGLRKEILSMRRKYDASFASVFNTLDRFLDGPEKKVRVKGFSQIKKD